jgi:hypothetical protein
MTMTTTDEIRSILDTLERAPDLIVPMVWEIPEERRKARTAAGKWSAHEHACHLADVHDLFFSRLELMLEHDSPEIEPFWPDEDIDLRHRSLELEMARYEADRRRLVERLRGLAPDDWIRSARHPEYSEYSVFILFRHAAMHDHLHGYRIEEILLDADRND